MIGAAGPGSRRYQIAGGAAGLAWAAALRGWMAQLAAGMPDQHPQVTWLTLALVLLPGVVIGTLLGHAASLRRSGLRAPRALVFAPVIFGSALLDPQIVAALIRNGTGGGSLIVVATALCCGYAVTRPGWSVRRALAGVVALLGLLVVFGMGGMAAPLNTPHGAWVSALGFALVLLLGLASALPYPPAHRTPGMPAFVALGALLGFAWAAGLFGLLAQLTPHHPPAVTWVGTFVAILLPGTAAGGLLGWTEGRRRHGGPARRWWLSAAACCAVTAGAVTVGAVTVGAVVAGEAARPAALVAPRAVWLVGYAASFVAVLVVALGVTFRHAAGAGTSRPRSGRGVALP